MPCIECSHIDKCCAASALLQSIALEETAISHILDAEGEKLQKAISISCEQKDLIEINKSVEDMIAGPHYSKKKILQSQRKNSRSSYLCNTKCSMISKKAPK
ncbi:MAG: hypothetical protein ACI4ES_08835 [Roseburia sp.]